MSKEKYAVEIETNMERAEQSIAAARKLVLEGYFDFAASRAYYGAFYAATALLLNDGLEFGKHSGVIALIHQLFVRTGRLEKNLGKDLNWLFELCEALVTMASAYMYPKGMLRKPLQRLIDS